MIVTKAYVIEREARIAAEAENTILKQQNSVLQTTMDWQRVRINQLELERAQMFFHYAGVKLPVPQVEVEEKLDDNPLNQIPDFNDVGDDMAVKLGVGWDENGNVTYKNKK